VPNVIRIKASTDPTGRIAPDIAPTQIHFRLFAAYPNEAPIEESTKVTTMKSGFKGNINPKQKGIVAKGRETAKLMTSAVG
jgi:hypothetical protein